MATITEESSMAEIIKDIQEKIHVIQCTLGFIIHHTGLDKKYDEVVNEAGVSSEIIPSE